MHQKIVIKRQSAVLLSFSRLCRLSPQKVGKEGQTIKEKFFAVQTSVMKDCTRNQKDSSTSKSSITVTQCRKKFKKSRIINQNSQFFKAVENFT